MSIKSIEDLLGEHKFFAGMSEEHLALLAGCGKNVVFQPGQILARTHDDAHEFYALRTGSVAIEIYTAGKGPVTLQTVGDNNCIGWSWIFPPYRWQFDVRALETVHAVSFDGICLRGKCQADPIMGYEFLKRFAQVAMERLAATRLQLLDIYGRSEDDAPASR